MFSSGSFMALAFTFTSMIHKALKKTKEMVLLGFAVLFRLDTKALTAFKQSASLDLIKIYNFSSFKKLQASHTLRKIFTVAISDKGILSRLYIMTSKSQDQKNAKTSEEPLHRAS